MVLQSSEPRTPLPEAREVLGASSAAPGGASQGEHIQTTLPPGAHPGSVFLRLHTYYLCREVGVSPAVWGSGIAYEGQRKQESKL